jgi:hypothetical protein
LDRRGELELGGVGRLGETCFGRIRDRVHREAAHAVEHANRLEDAARNRGLDAGHHLGRARDGLDRR